MTLQTPAILTQAGAFALLMAQAAGTPVQITHAAIGAAGHEPDRTEVALTDEFARVAIGAASVDVDARRLDVAALFTGDLVEEDTFVREIGLFTADDVLVFYASLPAGALGALTPRNDYAAALQIEMGAFDPAAIEFVEAGAPVELLVVNRVAALETATARLTRASRRNLFLATAS